VNLSQLCHRMFNLLPLPYSLREVLRKLFKKMLYLRQYKQNIRRNKKNNVISWQNIISNTSVMDPSCCGLTPELVSVILPVYNQANLLQESIESVLAQTYTNFELIIINDGSSDGVEKVLERYITHPKIKCFTQANQRLPKALSNGFNYASGEYWTWTSADNIMEPRMLETLVSKLKSDPLMGMVYADYYAIDDHGSLLKDHSWRSHNRPKPDSGEIRLPKTTEQLNYIQDNFIGPCFMYRGWIGRIIGDYDPQLGIEDYDYWMRINSFFKVNHLGTDDLLYRYRVHDNTLSAQAQEHRILDKVKKLMDYELERSQFYNQPFNILSDVECEKILKVSGLVINSQLIGKDGKINLSKHEKYDLIILTSSNTIQYMESLKDINFPVAIVIDKNEIQYPKLLPLLKRNNCIALVESVEIAARVKLISNAPIIDIKSKQTLLALRAFSKNKVFFYSTRDNKELERKLPSRIIFPNNKHILLQVDSFTNGGMENVVIDLGLYLKNIGFKVTVGNLGKSGDMAIKAIERGLYVEQFPKDFTKEQYKAWLKHNDVKIVNAHYSLFGADICKQEGIPFIETIHNSYVWFDPNLINAYHDADQYISKYICVSNTAAQYADIALGLDVTKMEVIRNGIDNKNIDLINFHKNRQLLRNSWNIDNNTPVFINVASIMATKAQLPLIYAFAQVVQKIPKARLILLGSIMENSYYKEIQRAIIEMNLQDNIIIAGYHREVAPYYHAADIFVLPSFWEGWSLSLGEAIANGLACVITDVGSAYEFIENKYVEIIRPPFGDITNLNYFNLGEYLYSKHDIFNTELAKAMLTLVEQIDMKNRSLDINHVKELDSMLAYTKYAEVFSSIN